MGMKRKNKTTSYSGSMVEPKNSYAREMWQKQQQSQKSFNPFKWIFPFILGIAIVATIAIWATITHPTEDKPVADDSTAIPEPTISDEEDLSAYFYQLVSEPDYVPEYSDAASHYIWPPTNITCADFKEVSKMDTYILNLYLDSGYVVMIDNKSKPDYLVYYGVYDDLLYRAIPINCSSPIDTTVDYESFNPSELFDSSSQRYFVWIDPKNLNQDREDS